jgi:superfamily II DNA/RNA helicase
MYIHIIIYLNTCISTYIFTYTREMVSVVTGNTHHRPVHVLVATPGRLCELITDEEIPMFRDMSGLRLEYMYCTCVFV